MTNQALKVGDKVWVKLPDGSAGGAGEIVGFTPKRIKVKNEFRDCEIGNYKPKNVWKRGA